MPSKSPAQHRLMEAVKHDKKFAEKIGIPQDVGREFADADDKARKRKDGRKSASSTTFGYGR